MKRQFGQILMEALIAIPVILGLIYGMIRFADVVKIHMSTSQHWQDFIVKYHAGETTFDDIDQCIEEDDLHDGMSCHFDTQNKFQLTTSASRSKQHKVFDEKQPFILQEQNDEIPQITQITKLD